MSFQSFFRQLPAMKHYFIAATLIFLIGCYTGYTSPETFQFIFNASQQRMQDIMQTVKSGDNVQLSLFFVILKNNLVVSLVTLMSGALFMIYPIFMLLTNGAMIGHLAALSAENGQLLALAKGIIPHGIIEIPAILIAAAYGIRFGMLTAKGLIAIPYEPARARMGKQFTAFFKSLIPLLTILIGLLIIAAILESTVTYLIVGK